MTANNYIESVKYLPVWEANAKLAEICGIQRFWEYENDVFKEEMNERKTSESKDEYGDWQTSFDLALEVCRLLKKNGVNPKIVVEPTCGKGNFILAALQVFDTIEDIYGIEIYKPYLEELKVKILQFCLDNPKKRKVNIHLYHQNIFEFNFSDIKKSFDCREVLVLGNPPWVTNSKLGGINSNNLPAKSNFKRLSGMDAITGKSNFDIAEYICRQMVDFLKGENARLALLLKTSVIKNIVYGQQENQLAISDIRQYNIDAKKEFNVSVSAALFYCALKNQATQYCSVKDFYTLKNLQDYGWVHGCFVSDMNAYRKNAFIDGQSPLKWWSGIKHDCAKVMELSYENGIYVNGLGEELDIEEGLIYPLVKSSDIKGKVITSTRKYVIVTQESTSDDTKWIEMKYPKTYQYLLDHADYLDNRSSRIYKGRSRFCIFGIGKYSFKPYKIAVSGLYKKPNFTIISPIAGKSVMLDDTCYMLGLDTYDEAVIAQTVLSGEFVQSFIHSLIFTDAKRVINKDLLMRINLIKALESMRDSNIDESKMKSFDAMLKANVSPKQYMLFE